MGTRFKEPVLSTHGCSVPGSLYRYDVRGMVTPMVFLMILFFKDGPLH